MSILIKENKLEDIVKRVACPFKAMKVEGGNCICTYSTKILKNELGPVSLGNSRDDIINHCESCSFKKDIGKEKEAQKVSKPKKLAINEFGQVSCPMSKSDVFIVEDCKSCPFFGKKETKQLKESMGPEFEIEHIFCHNPVIPKENLGAWLDDKTKKEIKKARKDGAVII